MSNISIINHQVKTNNGLFCLNDLHKASGNKAKHKPDNFLRLETTNSLITELEEENSNFSDMRSAKKVINGGKNRGTYVCKELVYHYAMWISAKFSLLVIRTFDKIQQKTTQPKLETPYIEGKELQHIKECVSKVVKVTGKHFKVVYGDLNRYFGAPNINQIDKKYYHKVCDYLGVSRDYIVPADTFNLVDNIANNNHVFGLSLLIKGEYAKRSQNGKLSNVEKLLNEAMMELEKARLLNSDICDGLSESRLYIDFDKKDIKEATKKAKSDFYDKYGEHPS